MIIVLSPAKGDPENPLSNFELKKKFRDLTLDVIGEDRSNKIYNKIINLKNSSSVNEIFKLITDPI